VSDRRGLSDKQEGENQKKCPIGELYRTYVRRKARKLSDSKALSNKQNREARKIPYRWFYWTMGGNKRIQHFSQERLVVQFPINPATINQFLW